MENEFGDTKFLEFKSFLLQVSLLSWCDACYNSIDTQ